MAQTHGRSLVCRPMIDGRDGKNGVVVFVRVAVAAVYSCLLSLGFFVLEIRVWVGVRSKRGY
jgi:hypothetical protein